MILMRCFRFDWCLVLCAIAAFALFGADNIMAENVPSTLLLTEADFPNLKISSTRETDMWIETDEVPKGYENPEERKGSDPVPQTMMTKKQGFEQYWTDKGFSSAATIDYVEFSSPKLAQNAVRIMATNMGNPVDTVGGTLVYPICKKSATGDLGYKIVGGSAGYSMVFSVGKYAFAVNANSEDELGSFVKKLLEKARAKQDRAQEAAPLLFFFPRGL